MRVINQSHKIVHITPNALALIEQAGRNCYRSEDRITDDSAPKFVEMLIRRGHESVLEFADLHVELVTDRGVMAEITRHRHASFAIESTRYCNYGGKEMEFIKPVWLDEEVAGLWNGRSRVDSLNGDDEMLFVGAVLQSEHYYKLDIKRGLRPEQARQVLNFSLATRIHMKANFREWRHIFKLRCAKAAHPQMRALMLGLLEEVRTVVPVVFDDVEVS